ncbi:tetratricopeptide repeat protein [uncultured Porphyromonas sp.]|uniref:tetratricopeptide repeat protein n=1 Tax=uncultured Porphyromonas sp. TaxID=159274 RepID=UPI00261C8646|nr:tetratricopeptide repeat protein [uncultured Porphyromonas sp.]
MSLQEHRGQDTLDVIDEKVMQGEQFFERHGKKIIIAVVVVVLAVIAIFAYIKFIKEPNNAKASSQMFVAEDNFIMGQDSLALKGATASPGFEGIAKNFSGTDAANLAHAYAGICLYDMGRYQEALGELQKFSSEEKLVAPSIQRMIGDCYVQLGKLEDALKSYESAAKLADSEAISPSCLIKAGHVYEKLGKYDQAVAAYQQIKDKYYTSPEAESVEADLIRARAAGGK